MYQVPISFDACSKVCVIGQFTGVSGCDNEGAREQTDRRNNVDARVGRPPTLAVHSL